MEINVNESTRVVAVWLTNEEKGNASVQQQINQLCREYKERKYRTAVFLSGQGDLVNSTQSLLLHNRYPKHRARER